MKEYTMFNFQFLMGDHFAKVSNQAKLYYVALNFYANKGFVSNPLQILDSMGYDKSVYWELVKNKEILTLDDRSEIFITSYYVHNPRFKPLEWLGSTYAVYWRGKLFIKKNGVATFDPNGVFPAKEEGLLANVENPTPTPTQTPNPQADKTEQISDKEWDDLLHELDEEQKDKKKQPF